jgi:hypothetical protein
MKELHDEKFGTSYMPECADEWLELLHDIAVGYDGCRSEESLKALIDEMVEYAGNARECMKQGNLYPKHYDTATTIGLYDTDKLQTIEIKYDGAEIEDVLYNARPSCKHKIQGQLSGGIKCVNCGGWFCY